MPENHSGDTVLGFLFATAVLVARLHSLEVDGSGQIPEGLDTGSAGRLGSSIQMRCFIRYGSTLTVHRCSKGGSSGVRGHARRADRVHGPPMGDLSPAELI